MDCSVVTRFQKVQDGDPRIRRNINKMTQGLRPRPDPTMGKVHDKTREETQGWRDPKDAGPDLGEEHEPIKDEEGRVLSSVVVEKGNKGLLDMLDRKVVGTSSSKLVDDPVGWGSS